MGFVGDIVGGLTGDTAADASIEGANIAAQAQREALEYLKQTEEIPQAFREDALKRLGGLYDLEGGIGSQQALIDRAQESPLYKAIIGAQSEGENAILRQASATGGLRSGNVQEALADYTTQLQNKALLESYNQQISGLTGLAQLPSNANQIAQQTSAVGQTLGQGVIAAGQAEQAGIGNLLNLGMQAFAAFSDRRLKKNVKKIGERDGFNLYEWEWNKIGNAIGLKGKEVGHMADEVEFKIPEAVKVYAGYKTVDYEMVANYGS